MTLYMSNYDSENHSVKYELNNNICTLTFDDGKANVVGHEFMDNINAGLDRAREENAGAIILWSSVRRTPSGELR
jgi:enoyl-CoA hydratase/carnithine racemase